MLQYITNVLTDIFQPDSTSCFLNGTSLRLPVCKTSYAFFFPRYCALITETTGTALITAKLPVNA